MRRFGLFLLLLAILVAACTESAAIDADSVPVEQSPVAETPTIPSLPTVELPTSVPTETPMPTYTPVPKGPFDPLNPPAVAGALIYVSPEEPYILQMQCMDGKLEERIIALRGANETGVLLSGRDEYIETGDPVVFVLNCGEVEHIYAVGALLSADPNGTWVGIWLFDYIFCLDCDDTLG